jgi:ATP-binding cassette, subfamily B, bacterial
VQRLPVGLLHPHQTGALISRLNNDVIGAQRAITGTLGSVVSNVIVLVTTVAAMFVLEWRLTLLTHGAAAALRHPGQAGRPPAAGHHPRADGPQRPMNTTMTERFNVAGALLVKLFGRHDDERRVRRAGRAGARHRGAQRHVRPHFFIALGPGGRGGHRRVYWVGGQLDRRRHHLGTLVAMAAYVARIYQPAHRLTNARVDVMTAFVSFERVFEVLDARNPIADRPGAVDLVDPRGASTRRRVVPLPAARRHVSLPLERPPASRATTTGRRDPCSTGVDLARSSRASWSPSSGRRAPARPRSPRSSPASTT